MSKVKAGSDPDALDRQQRISLDHALLELRRLAFLPQRRAMHDAIEQRSAVRTFRPLQRTRYADELALDRIAGHAHGSVAVSAHIDERQMRRQLRIGERSCLLDVTGLCVFEA